MTRIIENYKVELFRDMVYIHDNNSRTLLFGKEISPNNAIEEFNNLCKRVKNIIKKRKENL